ncbi:MAG: NAD-dependent epimerase/dehydratase family protein [Bacteroidia bacterium]
MTRTILVTGGAGNVGGSLVGRLVQNPENYVVIFDDLSTGDKDKLPGPEFTNWKFIRGDVNRWQEISAVMTSYRFDYVFHYAAVVGVKRTLENPMKVLADIEGIKNVLELSKNTGVKRIFYSSSSEVYGEPFEIPQNEETTPLNARLPYAVVKQTSECFIKSFHREYDLDYTIFRFFNTYGPKQSDDFVVPKFLSAAIRGENITIYGDGKQTRTFCYIDDNLDSTLKILYEGHCINDVINLGSEEEMTIVELAQTIINTVNSTSKIIHLPALAEGDMKRRCPDNTKMKNLIGRDLVTLEEGIRKMMSAYINEHSVRI